MTILLPADRAVQPHDLTGRRSPGFRIEARLAGCRPGRRMETGRLCGHADESALNAGLRAGTLSAAPVRA